MGKIVTRKAGTHVPKGKPSEAKHLEKVLNKITTCKVVEADGQVIVVLDTQNASEMASGIKTLIDFAESIANLRKSAR